VSLRAGLDPVRRYLLPLSRIEPWTSNPTLYRLSYPSTDVRTRTTELNVPYANSCHGACNLVPATITKVATAFTVPNCRAQAESRRRWFNNFCPTGGTGKTVGHETDCEGWRYSRDGFRLRYSTEVTTKIHYTVRRTYRKQLC
jgi:hypothetical protein